MTGNVIKSWITSIIGVLTMIITLVLVYQKVFDFVWEGIGGLAIGVVLLLAPDTIVKNVGNFIKSSVKSDNSDSPTNKSGVTPTNNDQ